MKNKIEFQGCTITEWKTKYEYCVDANSFLKLHPLLKKYWSKMKNVIVGFDGNKYGMAELIKLWFDRRLIVGDSDGLNDSPNKAIANIKETKTKHKGKYIDLKPLRDFIEKTEGAVKMQDMIKLVLETDLPDMTFEQMDGYLTKYFKL